MMRSLRPKLGLCGGGATGRSPCLRARGLNSTHNQPLCVRHLGLMHFSVHSECVLALCFQFSFCILVCDILGFNLCLQSTGEGLFFLHNYTWQFWLVAESDLRVSTWQFCLVTGSALEVGHSAKSMDTSF